MGKVKFWNILVKRDQGQVKSMLSFGWLIDWSAWAGWPTYCCVSCLGVHGWLIIWMAGNWLTVPGYWICADIDWMLAGWPNWWLNWIRAELCIDWMIDWMLAGWPIWLLNFALRCTSVGWLTGCWKTDLTGYCILCLWVHWLIKWRVVGRLTYLSAGFHPKEYIGCLIY